MKAGMKEKRVAGIRLRLALAITAASFFLAANCGSATRQPDPLTEETVAPAQALGKAYAAVARNVRPAVVSVVSERITRYRQPEWSSPFDDDLFRWFFGQPPGPQPPGREYRIPRQGLGSGSILDTKGHILTNYHVVRDVDQVRVTLADKRRFEAEVVGADAKTDVAIVRIKGPVPDDLPIVKLGDSAALQVGDLVLAIGAPFGYAQTVTSGIISATGRSNVGIADYEDFLQTDAPINPGNSGGPLVNMRGEVIGMNTAIATRVGQFSGVGFAIPIDMIKSLIPVLLKGGTVSRGYLGVVIQEMTDSLAREFNLPKAAGALIAQVTEGSPADKAGLKRGDVIIRFAGKEVTDTHALRNMVAETKPGTKVEVAILRQGKELTLRVTIGELAPEARAAAPSPARDEPLAKFGLTVRSLTPDLARRYDYEKVRGVIVTAVAEGSPASLGGVQAGDLIIEVNQQGVADIKEVRDALAKSRDKDRVLLLIQRREASIYVVLQAS